MYLSCTYTFVYLPEPVAAPSPPEDAGFVSIFQGWTNLPEAIPTRTQ